MEPFTEEDRLFLQTILNEKRHFSTVEELVKILNLLHFWPEEKLMQSAYDCFFASKLDEPWSGDKEESLEIPHTICIYFYQQWQEKYHIRSLSNELTMIPFTQKLYHIINNGKLALLLALCKNLDLKELSIEIEFPLLPFLLEKFAKRNPNLKSVHLDFELRDEFVQKTFGQLVNIPKNTQRCCFFSKNMEFIFQKSPLEVFFLWKK